MYYVSKLQTITNHVLASFSTIDFEFASNCALINSSWEVQANNLVNMNTRAWLSWYNICQYQQTSATLRARSVFRSLRFWSSFDFSSWKEITDIVSLTSRYNVHVRIGLSLFWILFLAGVRFFHFVFLFAFFFGGE